MEKDEKVNPLFCDPVTGVCEIPESDASPADAYVEASDKPIKLVYFTDPICSSCWGIEPQLKKLKLEYGHYFDIEYRMGGLLKSWDTYGGRDVSGPKSVAGHWDEASAWYKMPIDGTVWLEDPLDSSYPPSVAFKAAQMQGEEKALRFLRRIREMVFLEKKNITRWENIARAAEESGLDSGRLKTDFEGAAARLFEEDLALRQQLGVRGFPTIFFTTKDDNRLMVYGSKPYQNYEEALLKLHPAAIRQTYDGAIFSLLGKYKLLATMELAVLSGKAFEEAEATLEDLRKQNKVRKLAYRNGDFWAPAMADL